MSSIGKFSVGFFVFLIVSATLFGQIQIAGDLTIERNCRPGDRRQASIIVENTSTEAVDVKVYQNDYVFYADGTVSYLPPGDLPRSNSRWIGFTPSIVRIPAREQTQISITIEVPERLELEGTYWSLLLIEPIPDEEDDERDESEEYTLNLKEIVRYGIQVVTTVGTASSPVLAFRNPALYAGVDGRVLEADLENVGEAWIRPVYFCEIYDPLGDMVAKVELPRRRIYPDTSIRLSFTLPPLESGTHKALVVADAGGDRLYGAQYTLNIK